VFKSGMTPGAEEITVRADVRGGVGRSVWRSIPWKIWNLPGNLLQAKCRLLQSASVQSLIYEFGPSLAFRVGFVFLLREYRTHDHPFDHTEVEVVVR